MSYAKITILLSAFFLPFFAYADTAYKTVDEEGNVVFSDKPAVDAEQIELKKTPATEFKKMNSLKSVSGKTDDEQDGYDLLVIKEPQDQATIRDNTGNVKVVASVSPNLVSSHELLLEMDGNEVARSSNPAFTLSNIDRGSHTLNLSIVDAEGKKLKTANAVIFYMHRHSKLRESNIETNTETTPLNPPTVTPDGVTPTNPPSVKPEGVTPVNPPKAQK